MEWFYLALLAPFILVPVVLLFGYAGCGSFAAENGPTLPDLALSFEFDGTSVKLKWNAGPMGTMRYQLFRGPTGGEMPEILPGPGAQTQYTDSGLPELKRYFYTVIAINGANKPVAKSNQVRVDIPPAPPTNLTASATGANTVHLAWTNNPNPQLNYVVMRRQRVGSSADLVESEFVRTDSRDDNTPSAATDFTYQIAARLKPDDTTAPTVTSSFVPSPPLSVLPPPKEPFALVFPATPQEPNRPSDNSGDCIILRISKDLLQGTGNTKLRITFYKAPSGLGFTTATISQPARSGNPYDAHSDLGLIGSNLDLSQTQSTPVTINYALDRTQDLLLAFDIKSAPGFTTVPVIDGVTGCVLYFKDATQDAGKNVRSAGFMAFPNTFAIVEKIEAV